MSSSMKSAESVVSLSSSTSSTPSLKRSAPPPADDKRKKTKSRNGCLTCKKKRLKCSEERPFCGNCQKRNVLCSGYATAFKWKTFDDTATGQKVSMQNSQKHVPQVSRPNIERESMLLSANSDLVQKALEAATLSVTGRSTAEIAIANDLIAKGRNPELARALVSTINNFNLAQAIKKDGNVTSASSQSDALMQTNLQSNLQSGDQPVQIKSETPAPKAKSVRLQRGLSPTDLLNPTKSDTKSSSSSTSAAPSDLENGLDEESKGSLLVHPRPDIFSTRAPSPDFHPPSAGISPFSMSSPSDFFKVASPTVSNAQSPLNLHAPQRRESLSVAVMSPGNPLLELISMSTKADGYLDSPRLAAALSDNPAAMEQFQAIAASSPNFGTIGTPGGIQQPLNADQIASHIASPSFSSFISAFTNFEGDLAVPSPGNLDMVANSPEVSHIKAKEEEDKLQRSKNRSSSQSAYPSTSSQSGQMVVVKNYTSNSPESAASPFDISKLPKYVELGDQYSKMLSAFDRYTCGIMSMKNGPTENPWRTVVLPLARDYSVMFNALSSMTCFHVARGDSVLRSQGMKHMKTAIVELVHGLKDKTIPPDVALATCIALAMSEAWDRHISTGIAHLKGARTMILQILQNIKTNMGASHLTTGDSTISAVSPGSRTMSVGSTMDSDIESLHRSNSSGSMYRSNSSSSLCAKDDVVPKGLKFLFNAWVYFDVLARMTSEEDDETYENVKDEESDFAVVTDDDVTEIPRKKKRSSTKSKSKQPNLLEAFKSFNLKGGDEIDPLLGVGQTLFPIIGRVASLISKVRKENKNSLTIVSQAVELKSELEKWQPSSSAFKNTQIEDPLLDLASAISTAEAYRYSTLIYLHQAVPEIPSKSSHALAEKVLMLFASIPASSRTCIAHIFPLLVASCEARPGDERAWCKNRWELLSQKLWIGNVDRSLEVVKEVWARKDIFKKRKMKAKAQSQYDGSNSSNDHRGSNGSEDEEHHARLAFQISGYLNSEDDNVGFEFEGDRIKSWTHWTTVMKDWGWEVLLG